MPGKQLTDELVAYIRQWRFDEGDSLAPSVIARRLGRNKSTIMRHLGKKSVGKWKKYSEAQPPAKLVRLLVVEGCQHEDAREADNICQCPRGDETAIPRPFETCCYEFRER